MDKKKVAAYKRARAEEGRCAKKKYGAFRQMVDCQEDVKFKRVYMGKVHTGRVIEIHPYRCALLIENIKTGAKYWIEESYLEL